MAEQQSEASPPPGWLVHSAKGYYTGIVRTPLEIWTPFVKLAKIYKHQRRAQKRAARLGGQVIPVEEPAKGQAFPLADPL